MPTEPSTTPDLIERIWQQIDTTVYLSRREFVAGLEGWTIEPRYVDNQLIGASLVRGPEFHFVTFGFKKSLPAKLIIDCLQPIIDEHGFVLTRTPKEDVRQRRFNLLIGFDVEYEDEFYIIYRLNRLNLHRGKECPS